MPRGGGELNFHARNNFLVMVFVFVEFQMSTVCNLHGFSPQDGLSLAAAGLSENAAARAFYNSFAQRKPFNERLYQFSRNGDILTREIRIKQGRLKGVVKEFKDRKLEDVETFLGVPYAAPPVGPLRFMPPGSPPTWRNLKIFDGFAPACPQKPPDLSHEPFKTMNAGYFHRLKGLMPFLANQSEDCLYLNIYAPLQDKKFQKKYPVIVYIHGESFEWNSGNPYDGSILASYGNVVVVTINFRLGILGFLRPGLSEHTVSNFGLLDQIAALQWIKDNIEEFGGDPSLVTLLGHGTGAACINFLMVSPVSMASQGLFHKAILMSGTALSDWALTQNPLQFTIQVAEALNCPLIDKNDELSNCLRRKRLSEIMSVKITVPEFQTPFGPIVDGSVVPNTPHQVMGVYQSLFTRYEMLYGITEWETYHSLDPVSLTYGMLEGERNEFLRKYMYSRYEALPFFALATTLSEYLDWRKGIPPAKSAAEEHRDLVLDLLSDARFAAPVVQMALYHSKINPKSYLYVFKHKSKMGEFAGSERSVSGEEIPYVFGIPLVNEEGPLAHHKFSVSEQLLSESILTYFTNFAKTGNPNAPRRLEYLTQGPKEWQQFDVYWPEYDSVNQSYLALEVPPHLSHHYRSQMTKYWNEILPNLLSNPTKLKQHKVEMPVEEDFRNSYEKPPASSLPRRKEDSPWTYGTIRTSPKGKRPPKAEEEGPSSKQMDRPSEDAGTRGGEGEAQASSVPYFVALTLCLLVLNVVIVGFYCYKKRKTNSENECRSSKTAKEDDENGEEKINRETKSGETVYSVVECSEANRSGTTNDRPGRLKKYLVESAESHAKVKKWIQQEILEKCSKSKKTPKTSISGESSKTINKDQNQRRNLPTFDSVSEASSKAMTLPKPILKNAQRICRSNEDLKTTRGKSVQKVSVGVDATPSTRGESVLKQTPIEITKSLDRGLLGGARGEASGSVRRSRTSVSLQVLPTITDVKLVTSAEPEILKLRSKVDSPRNKFRTFLPKDPRDINVTSRDSEVPVTDDPRADPLENIQKRNFPKVLPDFPESKPTMRLSFPQSSLPTSSEQNRNKQYPPPPPPPRVSTLRRKSKRGSGSSGEDAESERAGKSTAGDGGARDQDTGATARAGRRREQPAIVIHSKIGPTQKSLSKKPHVNLQDNDQKIKSSSTHVLDSKGPSDRAVKERETAFKI